MNIDAKIPDILLENQIQQYITIQVIIITIQGSSHECKVVSTFENKSGNSLCWQSEKNNHMTSRKSTGQNPIPIHNNIFQETWDGGKFPQSDKGHLW